MTLVETIKAIEIVASGQPSINMVVQNDIFRLNSKADARYGVFGWTQGQHSGSSESSLLKLTFTFFYVDRLKADKSNQIEVQSVGMQTLDQIIRTLDERGVYCDSWTFQPFNQRFLDECAGVFSNVTLNVPTSSCIEAFADFNNDFNEDFMIW